MKPRYQHVWLMLSLALPSPILLSGCARASISDGARQVPMVRPLAELAIAQLGYEAASYYGTCLAAACPVPTPKTIVASPPIVAPSGAERDAPLPQAQPTVPVSVQVHFASASAELDASDSAALVRFSNQAHHAARITVTGRTDNVGNHAFNQRLARQRASAVAAFLREQVGVAPARITVEGHGACCYVADNATDAGRQANRRTVVTFHLAQEAAP